MPYRGEAMKQEGTRLRTEDPDVRDYISQLRRQHAYSSSAQDARKAVDRALGGDRLTDLLYESRRERSV
jgi:hypothetical protein